MSSQEREEIIAIIVMRKNYALEMLHSMTDEQLLKLLEES